MRTIIYFVIVLILNSCNVLKMKNNFSEIIFFEVYIHDQSDKSSVVCERDFSFVLKGDSIYNLIEKVAFPYCNEGCYNEENYKIINDKMKNIKVQKIDSFRYKNTTLSFYIRALTIKGRSVKCNSSCTFGLYYDETINYPDKFISINELISAKRYNLYSKNNIKEIRGILDNMVLFRKNKQQFKNIK